MRGYMKRIQILTGLMVPLIFAGILSGCSTTEAGGGDFSQISPSAKKREYGQDITQIVVTYQTYEGSVLTDLEEVTEALNAVTVPEIGVEVTFRLVDAQEAFSEYPLWISRGEEIDLMILNYHDITTYVNRGMLCPLDALLETEGQDILSLLDEGCYVTEGAVIKGQTYGTGIVPDVTGRGLGLWAAASLLEKIGFDYEETHIYTVEELTDFFARAKALYPDRYPLGQISSGQNYTFYSYYFGRVDALGAELLTGILSPDGRIVNFYETEEYAMFLKQMREWYQAGYLYPDAAFTDSYLTDLVRSGLLLTYPYTSLPNEEMQELFGEAAVCLRTGEPMAEHQNSKGMFWTIPVTSTHRAEAMRFLDLMYADARISNLIQYGIRGKHYVVLDVETGSITFPYGVSRQTTGYYNPLGLYGDRRNMYTFNSPEFIRKRQAYSEEAMKNRPPFRDFVYLSDRVSLELSAASKIVERYVPLLESGCIDPEPCYQEFLTQLRLAGIDRIIADKQAQYDEWLAKE